MLFSFILSNESEAVLATLPAELEDLQLAASPAASSECGSSDPSVNKGEGEELAVPLANLSF